MRRIGRSCLRRTSRLPSVAKLIAPSKSCTVRFAGTNQVRKRLEQHPVSGNVFQNFGHHCAASTHTRPEFLRHLNRNQIARQSFAAFLRRFCEDARICQARQFGQILVDFFRRNGRTPRSSLALHSCWDSSACRLPATRANFSGSNEHFGNQRAVGAGEK